MRNKSLFRDHFFNSVYKVFYNYSTCQSTNYNTYAHYYGQLFRKFRMEIFYGDVFKRFWKLYPSGIPMIVTWGKETVIVEIQGAEKYIFALRISNDERQEERGEVGRRGNTHFLNLRISWILFKSSASKLIPGFSAHTSFFHISVTPISTSPVVFGFLNPTKFRETLKWNGRNCLPLFQLVQLNDQ